MTPMTVSLCFPDEEKSCFACCPPIRAAGYEHIEYKNFINRAAEKAGDDTHRLKILKAISTYETKVSEMKSSQFISWQKSNAQRKN